VPPGPGCGTGDGPPRGGSARLPARTVAIPRRTKIPATRRAIEHARGSRRLVKWRNGSEGRISYLNVSIAHCAFFPSGVLEEFSLAGFYLDTQAAAASAADMHGGEFATLDLVQNGLPGDAEGGGGLLQR